MLKYFFVQLNLWMYLCVFIDVCIVLGCVGSSQMIDVVFVFGVVYVQVCDVVYLLFDSIVLLFVFGQVGFIVLDVYSVVVDCVQYLCCFDFGCWFDDVSYVRFDVLWLVQLFDVVFVIVDGLFVLVV